MIALLTAVGCTSACRGCDAEAVAVPPQSAQRVRFDVFTFGRVLGTVAPCGCTTEPLGGLQFAFGTITAEAQPEARLVVEPGSFLFPDPEGAFWPTDDAAWEQARERARMLQQRFAAEGDGVVGGVGPTDVASAVGVAALDEWPMRRVAANVSVGVPTHHVVTLRADDLTWTIGVTSVVEPGLPGTDRLGIVEPAVAKATEAVRAMTDAGAEFRIVLAQGRRAFAETLAREVPGVELVVVGVPEGVEPERVGGPIARLGNTYVVEPGTQLQTISRLSLSVDATAKSVAPLSDWTIVPAANVVEEELGRVEARIAKWKGDPEADAAFVARLEAERDRLKGTLAGEVAGAAVATFEQVKVTCRAPVDERAQQALRAYDQSVADRNRQRFAGVKAPPVTIGKPAYVGGEACSDCHDEAADFWQTTRHAQAYETLQEDNKEFDLLCVGCHVTGFRKPGGSEVVENLGLRDVQCESCHGPGSAHVDDGGNNLSLIARDASAELCLTECHTPEHSDTFAYDAYLRDILGPGHGAERRLSLGNGPTGRELREAGLARAGGSCKQKAEGM